MKISRLNLRLINNRIEAGSASVYDFMVMRLVREGAVKVADSPPTLFWLGAEGAE